MWMSRKVEEIKTIQEEEGKVTQGKWSVSDEGVAHAKKESQPSSAGVQNTKGSPVWQMQKDSTFSPWQKPSATCQRNMDNQDKSDQWAASLRPRANRSMQRRQQVSALLIHDVQDCASCCWEVVQRHVPSLFFLSGSPLASLTRSPEDSQVQGCWRTTHLKCRVNIMGARFLLLKLFFLWDCSNPWTRNSILCGKAL